MITWEHIGNLKGNGETLLVIDEDYLMRELLSDILSINGYHVIMAMNPEHARQLFEDRTSGIDLIITDIKLSGLGTIMTEALETRSTPMMVFTRDRLPRKNPPTFIGLTLLEKPFDILSLFKTIKETLQEKKGLSSDTPKTPQSC